MAEYVIMPKADYVSACDATRAKTGKTELIKSGELATEIGGITVGSDIPDGTDVTFGVTYAEDSPMAYYNGVLLPGISAEIKSSCPNLIIMQSTGTDDYYMVGAPSGYNWYFGKWDTLTNVLIVSANVTISVYMVNSDGTAWELEGSFTGQGVYPAARLIWSNNDIPNGSATATTIYFEGSAPVEQDIPMYPVDREEKYSITSEDLNNLAYAIQQKTNDYTLSTVQEYTDRVHGIEQYEPETKTISPDFSTGDMVVTPTDGSLLSEVTIQKPDTLLPENIALGVNIAGVVGTLEAGTSDDVRYVTFMNGETVLYVKPVAVGDDCVDVVSKGLIETPTKEADAQYTYTYYGWGASDGGAADSTILQNITEDKTVYAIFTQAARLYTITFYDDDGTTVLATKQVAYGTVPSYTPTREDVAFDYWTPTPVPVTGDATYTAVWAEKPDFATASWAKIAEISASGKAAEYFSVGDTKTITLSGTMGTLALDRSVEATIIGIYHNAELEGSGIHIMLPYADRAFADSKCNWNVGDGTKYFNMMHWGGYNYGGWKGCDLRYDVLGGTDVPPSGYGASIVEGRVGYDATETCATNPVPNTLMSCLPEDLRVVMKPMTKWTYGGGGKSDTDDAIESSVDYISLMSAHEIAYTSTDSTYESNYQQTYSGITKKRGKHNAGSSYIGWYTRSPVPKDYYDYIYYTDTGIVKDGESIMSLGIVPIFMV